MISNSVQYSQTCSNLYYLGTFSLLFAVAGVEICGSLKNVVALAAGFVDGLGFGSNTKVGYRRLEWFLCSSFSALFFTVRCFFSLPNLIFSSI